MGPCFTFCAQTITGWNHDMDTGKTHNSGMEIEVERNFQ
jgi:hypothetical protein